MKIVIDSNIPFLLAPLQATGAQVISLPAELITPEVVADADALFIRTRTRCDARLLEGSKVRFIATATIGTDHIDLPYCSSRGIEVANAPGCNAPAVAQWVLAAIRTWLPAEKSFSELTLGVIGAGHVGSILIRWTESLGMRVLVNDPPRSEAEGSTPAYPYVSLPQIARESDVITIHTPLTRSGSHPTHHLIGPDFLKLLKRKPLLLNAARGPVADTSALISAHDLGLVSALGIDCWEPEPDISLPLLSRALVTTPHIAGYSLEGKVRATAMALEAFSRHFGLPLILPDAQLPAPIPGAITPAALTYDIQADTRALKAAPGLFENLRNNYCFRPEPK